MTSVTGEYRSALWAPLRSGWRWPLAAAMCAAALAHIPAIGSHLHEAPYMGEEFVVLTVACLALTVAVVLCDSVAAYALGAAVCGLAVLGYIATRLVAFPLLADDVGNWFEPLGVISVVTESSAVAIAIRQVRIRCAQV